MIATLGELLTSLETTLAQALAAREVLLAGAAAIGGLLLAQIGIMAWTVRRLRELGHLRERMSRLADGLSLLTDTTEAGLQTIIRQVEHLGRSAMAAKAAPRAAVSRRVAAAARKGQPLASIAMIGVAPYPFAYIHIRLDRFLKRMRVPSGDHVGAP